jgi:hypothetical protein
MWSRLLQVVIGSFIGLQVKFHMKNSLHFHLERSEPGGLGAGPHVIGSKLFTLL